MTRLRRCGLCGYETSAPEGCPFCDQQKLLQSQQTDTTEMQQKIYKAITENNEAALVSAAKSLIERYPKEMRQHFIAGMITGGALAILAFCVVKLLSC